MPNGTELKGNSSSSQSAVILPNPANLNQYYIFTVQAISHRGGLHYSILDMSLNAGRGDIMPAHKNINLLEHSAEKIAAVEDGIGGYWVLSYAGVLGNESRYDTFHAFRINSSGINPSIKSTFSDCGTVDGRGYLKISANASKVVLCNQNLRHVCLHDFDVSTGILTGQTSLDTTFSPYSAEFSPSSEKLYISTGGLFASNDSTLYQFDLTSSDIQNSRTVVFNERSKRGALQLGIDGKIYYARPERTFIGVINNPESNGLDSNYVNEGVGLNGMKCKQGLPPFVQSYLVAGINANNACEGELVEFSLNSSVVLDAVTWDFGDGTTSSMENPYHTYNAPGTYTVTAIITIGTSTRSLNREVQIIDTPTASPVSNYYTCDGDSIDGTELFNLELKNEEVLGELSSEAYNVSYFLNMDDVIAHQNALPYNYSNAASNQEIIAKLYNPNNIDCYDTANFQLIVERPSVAYNVENKIICDDASNDGREIIDLSRFTPYVLHTQSASSYNVTYHLTQQEANDGEGVLPENYELYNDTQVIFARIENNGLSLCYDTTSFELSISDYMPVNQADNIYLCDDASNNGTEAFDLTLQDDAIAAGFDGSYVISYFELEEEAEINSNPIEGLYNNIENRQEIFFRIENTENLNCYRTGAFFIEVLEYETLEIDSVWYKCENSPVVLSADGGYDDYLWSTGQTTREITVYTEGTYEVTVTKYHPTTPETSCEYSKTVEVIASQEPTIVNIEVEDWSENNNGFTVTVEGNGDYEYSLNDIDYQDSNVFEGLRTGDYTVFVREKKGCGEVSKTVYALFHPKFFTPNGDGYHDYWQLYFSEQESDIEVTIYDRYGKLIKKIDPRSKGWDGTLNGLPLPTSDYWFVVNRPSINKQYKGHFTLKR